MTLVEIATEVRCHPDTIWRAVRAGLLHGQRIGPKKWIVARVDYEDWRARGAPTTVAKQAQP